MNVGEVPFDKLVTLPGIDASAPLCESSPDMDAALDHPNLSSWELDLGDVAKNQSRNEPSFLHNPRGFLPFRLY